MAKGVLERFGAVHTVVANAGIGGPTTPMHEIDLAAWRECLSIDLDGVFLTFRAFIPSLIAAGAGSLIAISSMTGKRPLYGRTPYAASKMGVIGLVRTLALELGPHGIRVNAVCPGAVGGPRLDAVFATRPPRAASPRTRPGPRSPARRRWDASSRPPRSPTPARSCRPTPRRPSPARTSTSTPVSSCIEPRRGEESSVTTTAPTIETVRALAAKYNNWGKWGPDDQLGTINYITPEKIIEAGALVRKGKVFSLALPLDGNGPMTGAYGRVNPIHVMLQDGGDIASGAQDHFPALRYTDDAVYLVLQCATQWDALAHIYHEGKMYNGYGTEAGQQPGRQQEQHHPGQGQDGRAGASCSTSPRPRASRGST